jgi:conserved hypothetical protein, YceG family
MAGRKRQGRKKKGSGAAGLTLFFLLLVLAAAAGVAWLVLMPYGPAIETFVRIEPGSSATAIGWKLESAGIVRSQFAFDLVRWIKHGRLMAGEYRFDHPASVTEVYARIRRGDVYTVALTVPEGANIYDIASRVEAAGLGTREEFINAATEEAGLVADLDPAARNLEGYLFPDTYRFARGVKPTQIATAMVRRFRAVAGQLGLNEDVHQVVTIASLVERETAVDEERPLVASVFVNRLKKSMPLMTDPAVIYGLERENRWRGTLYASDLTHNTAYNTYLHAGLPPGPIANPGIHSLRAAIEPAKSDYLYFVAASANAQGHSMFESTLEEHNRDVALYRRAMKKAGLR